MKYSYLAAPFIVLAVAGALLFVLTSSEVSPWPALIVEIQSVQRHLHQLLAKAMRSVQEQGVTAGLWLIVVSFLYGVFHAAGPGHGKVVISTYLFTQESQLRRGIALSLIGSLLQGATAIVAVTVTVELLRLSMRVAQGVALDLEVASYALVGLMGVLLVLTRSQRLGMRLLARRREKTEAGLLQHDHASHCGHDHGPDRETLERKLSIAGLVGMAASIGIRPCTGAILVLLVATSLDLRWTGMAAVLAMSLGTGLAVSVLATLAVYARRLALRWAAAGTNHGDRLTIATDLVALAGGMVIFVAGALLFQAAWSMPQHPLM